MCMEQRAGGKKLRSLRPSSRVIWSISYLWLTHLHCLPRVGLQVRTKTSTALPSINTQNWFYFFFPHVLKLLVTIVYFFPFLFPVKMHGCMPEQGKWAQVHVYCIEASWDCLHQKRPGPIIAWNGDDWIAATLLILLHNWKFGTCSCY